MASSRRGQQAVTIANGGAALALVIVLAAVALVVNPPSPPGIAEFAPQASKPITKAPDSQAATHGQGPGGASTCANPRGCPRPTASAHPTVGPSSTATPPPRGVPSALQCYSWPDGSVTQTFDPQSPPCVASWPGQAKGNGGATSKGVTATQIRVAVPERTAGTSSALKPWVDFFNSHFELYGRHIVIVPVSDTGDSPSVSHAAAATAASLNVFASVDETLTHGTAIPQYPAYGDDLASHHVIALSGGGDYTSESSYAAHAPYQWSFRPPQDTLQRATGNLVCRQLAGHPAIHSSSMKTKTRVFGILIGSVDTTETPPVSAYQAALAACGIHPHVYETQNDPTQTKNTVVFSQMSRDGVTSVLTVNSGNATSTSTQNAMLQASKAAYFPEWIVPGGTSDEAEGAFGDQQSASEAQGLFGLGSWNPTIDTPNAPAAQSYVAQGGDPSNIPETSFYDQLQILASGVQAAGPNLTPATFAAGLQGTSYPNPGTAAAPSYQARVGFQNGHVAINDYALVWFNTSKTSQQGHAPTSSGGWCYVAAARRYQSTNFPAQDDFQDANTSRC